MNYKKILKSLIPRKPLEVFGVLKKQMASKRGIGNVSGTWSHFVGLISLSLSGVIKGKGHVPELIRATGVVEARQRRSDIAWV